MENTKKGDFIQIVFTGRTQGKIFDTNDEEHIKEIDSENPPRKVILIVGEHMVNQGFDNALEGKEFNKKYSIEVPSKEAFGPRRTELIRTIPMKAFIEKNVYPKAGMTLALDGALVRISAVSGSRVIADFNHPLAGKDLSYDFKILHIVHDVKERAETFFGFFFRFIPNFEVHEKEVIVTAQKPLEPFINAFAEKFEKLVGKKLSFKEEEKKPIKSEELQNPEVETQQSL
ncbi:MAG: FKBP-type peptidyl-prolyl cis-trans isomerase [Nanoarchaeota archaeon]